MITTVTSSTITSVTTMISLGMILGVVAVIGLVVLLCTKELTGASSSGSIRRIAKSLDVGIVPLIIAFTMIVAIKVMEILA